MVSLFVDGFRFLMLSASYPRGATFNIVGPHRVADVEGFASTNVENGTSAENLPYQCTLPGRCQAEARHLRRTFYF